MRPERLRSFTAGYRDDKIQRAKADVAQLVEQPIRNRQVTGSSPVVGSKCLQISSSSC
jgi:hypothetical protein